MDFVAFSHYYASLIEPKVRESKDGPGRKQKTQKRKLRHYSPWKVALLNDFCSSENKVQLGVAKRVPADPLCYMDSFPRNGCHGYSLSRDGCCHDYSLSRDTDKSMSRDSNSLDLVEYCLQLLDRYSVSGSFVCLNKSNFCKCKSFGSEMTRTRRMGSLYDAPLLEERMTSRDNRVTSRGSSVTESSESPSVSPITSDSYSPEHLLQTFYDIDSLSNEDYHHYKEQIDRNRIAKNTSHVIQQLDSQLADICQRVNSGSHHGSPRGSVSASPIPTTLPPKSPSFRRSRESLSRPNSSKRTKTSGPASLQGESTPNHVITTPRDAMAKSREDFQSPSSPDLSAENLVASTPKISAKSSENIVGTQPEHAYDLDFDDDDSDSDSVDQDVSEIELPDESTIPRASQHVLQGISRDEHVESDESEEIPEEEAYSDDNAFDDDELFEEAEKPTPGYSLRDPNYNPLDDDSEDEMEESRSPSPVVKRRPTNKSYREEDDSIFSFDGWSKMKNRNSMSADDAQQNIPMGHVAKMRQAVDELNRAKRVKTGVKTGVEIVPKGNECKTKQPKSCPIDGEEDDDFTISSLSDRDMSPVEMKVDIKRSSRNGIDDVL